MSGEVNQSLVYVGGINGKITEAVLRKNFEKFGKILEINIPHSSSRTGDLGYAFIEFSSPTEAKFAIDNMHMSEIDGSFYCLKIRQAAPSRGMQEKRTLPEGSESNLDLSSNKRVKSEESAEEQEKVVIETEAASGPTLNSEEPCPKEPLSEEEKYTTELPEVPSKPASKSSGVVFGSAAKTTISFAAIGVTSESPNNLFKVETEALAAKVVADSNDVGKLEGKHVETGEEDEVSLCSSRCKLFEMDSESKEWVDKGIGIIKLNSSMAGEKYSRIVLRAVGVPRVLLNVRLYLGFKYELTQGKNVRMSTIIDGTVHHFLIRFRTEEEANEFTIELDAQLNLVQESGEE